MKLFNSLGPNPRVVRMFALEKGLDLEFVEVDLMAAENRQQPYLAKNPSGQLPALELDSGETISEISAICEYLEDIHPNPPLFGSTPEEKARTRSWSRKADLAIAEPMANGFRYAEGLALFEGRFPLFPESAPGLKSLVQTNLAWFDGVLAGRPFVAGDRFSYADIALYVILDFGACVGQAAAPELKHVAKWFELVGARPSAAASLHPASEAVGIRG